MTSLAVISSAVARIHCLKELLKNPESFPNEGNELKEGLEEIKESLVAASDHRKAEAAGKEFVDLEKQIVRLSYEIVDAIADVSSKSKEKFSVRNLDPRKSSGHTKLKELQQELKSFKEKLAADPEKDLKIRSGAAYPAGSEIQEEKVAGPEQKPKEKHSLFPWKKSGSTKAKEENPEKPKSSGNTEIGEVGLAIELNPKSTAASPGSDVDIFHEIMKDLLNSQSSESSVVYIVGESGMGKTNLAKKLFHDHQLRSNFDVFAWVSINHNFQIKRVLQLLLQKLGPPVDIRKMNEIQLIARIFAVLKNKTYLLVLDGIGALDDWESIRLALPIANSTGVIITTSSNKFAHLPHSYQIRGLTQPEILTLLNQEASFKHGSEKVGEAIFDISGGSPLFATILGKSLESEVATSEQQLVRELQSYKDQKGTRQVLGACYKRLTPEWKPCLLYLAQFPQDQDIEVDKLYLLLVAENLITSPKESESESESEISPQSLIDNLEKLARRNLVEVQEAVVATRGIYKSCRLHEQVREFCKSKGLDEEFLEIVDLGSSTKVGSHTRRLAIYLSKHRSDKSNIQFNSQDTPKKILSLLIFDTFESSAEEKSEWPSEIHDLKEFIHLRILNFDGVDFKARKVPRGIDRLVLLRYLSFRGCRLEELPSSMSNLTQLETLDLLVHADCKMLIPNGILTNMKRMVHLYLPRLYESNGKTKLDLDGLERLEILVNFNTEVCDVKLLSEFKNLKILATISKGDKHTQDLDDIIKFINEQAKGRLQHSSVDITSFNCYNRDSVSAFKNLLECQFVHSIHIEGRIGELPEVGNHAEKVAEIFLDGAELEHDPMNYLGRFQNLRSLVLSNDAFLGSEILISAAASRFPHLRSLKLQNLQYLEKLTIEGGAMPKLSALQIDSCSCLQELSIPKTMHDRLKKVQGEDEGATYMVMPSPAKFIITTSDQIPSTSKIHGKESS